MCMRRFCDIIYWSDHTSSVDAFAQKVSWFHFAVLAWRMFHVLIRAFAPFSFVVFLLSSCGRLERVYAAQLNSQRFSISRALAFADLLLDSAQTLFNAYEIAISRVHVHSVDPIL